MAVFDVSGKNLFSSSPLISLIMYSRDRPELFKQSVSSMVQSCSDVSQIEVICKFDYDDPQLPAYLDTAKWIHGYLRVHVKTVISDRLDGYWSIHTYLNDLATLARGKILWILGDDILASGDWLNLLGKTRQVFQDCIYVINTPGVAVRKTKMIAPAVSREWIDAVGIVSSHPAADRLLYMVANQHGRLIMDAQIMNEIIITHNPKNTISRLPINLSKPAIKDNLNAHANRLSAILSPKLKG